MSDQPDQSQKTEQPTQRRLDDARKKGQIPLSRDVGHWFMFLGLLGFVGMMLPSMMRHMMTVMRDVFFNIAALTHGSLTIFQIAHDVFQKGFYIVAPVLGLFVVLSLVSGLSQTQMNFSFKSITPSFDKISPLKGLSKLFGMKAFVEFIKNLIKFGLVGFLTFWIFWPEIEQMDHLTGLSLDGQLSELYEKITLLLLIIVSVMFVVSVLDYGYQKFQHIRSLKMSKQELKEEFKESEGDPLIKSRLRQLRNEKSRNRMIQDAATATVLVTNPTHFSIALKYDHASMDAPVVVAKGMDYIALRLREVATENRIPIIQNPPLARALYSSVKVGAEISSEHYEAVAGIIRLLLERGQIKME